MSTLIPPAIPTRASSQSAITELRLRNRESLRQLKRKLSDGSVAEGSEKHTKLKIDAIEMEQEGLRIDREELVLEYKEKRFDGGRFNKACDSINKRISSLGEDLWQSKQELRSLKEKTGKISLLTIDSDTLFATTLLRLYKDPFTKNRSSTEQSTMRRESIQVYNARKTEDGYDMLRCTLLDEYFPAGDVVTAHIVPARLGPELVDYIFGEGIGSRLFRSENSILMHKALERAFDNANIVLVPVDRTESPIRRWKIVVSNRSAKKQPLVLVNTKTLGDVDGKEIRFLTGHRPASRFLYFHFVISLLRGRAYRQPGWETALEDLKSGYPWPTPGAYLRSTMLIALAKVLGDVNESYLEALAREYTFDQPNKLAADEEKEIARRIAECFEERKESHEDGDDEMGDGDGDEVGCKSDEEDDENQTEAALARVNVDTKKGSVF
jgi:hypothetical protein